MLVFSWKSAVIEEEKVYGKKKDLRKLYREDKKRLNSAMDSLEDSVADKDEFYARVGAFIDNI